MLVMLQAPLRRATQLLPIHSPLGFLARHNGNNSTVCKLLTQIDEPPPTGGRKVTVVGVGQVGVAVTFALLSRGITNDVCLVDSAKERMTGEMLDLQQGSVFLNDAKITSSTDFAASANSRIVVVTAGARQEKGESRLSLLQRNADIMQTIIPPLVKHSPDSTIIIISNPVDIMTYIAWKVSKFPISRIFGTGTTLDSARFRFFIAQRLGVAPSSVHGYIVGEHGDSSVPVWSSTSVAGVRLAVLNPAIGSKDDPEKWSELHTKVVRAAYEVQKHKGYTNWAIAMTTIAVVAAIMDNTQHIYPVSTLAKGYHCIEDDVFLSLPCVLGANGISSIVQQTLNENEQNLLLKSVEVLLKGQSTVKIKGNGDGGGDGKC